MSVKPSEIEIRSGRPTRPPCAGWSRRWTILFASVGSILSLGTGCGQPANKVSDKTFVTREGVIDETPQLTAVERSDRFKFAFKAGMHWVEQKQFAVAMGAFEEAVNMNPASAEALFNLGACYEQVGEPLKAIQIYRQVLQVSPDDPVCYGNLGTSYIKLYQLEHSPVWRKMAMDSWRQSLSLDPNQPDVRKYLAQSESME